MDPTPEQQQAIDLFKTGGSLAIEAGAGTGKTSTLVMLAAQAGRGRQGQYVAFNKALVAESAGKFSMNVTCNTAHSLAFRALGYKYKPRLDHSARMKSRDLAEKLGLGFPVEATTFDGKPKALYPGYIASLAATTVRLFCQSADEEIGLRHTPRSLGLDDVSEAELAFMLVPLAKRMWADLQEPLGWAPFKHEHYLKMWQLSDPKINADFVLFDESQDANPVIAAIVAAQAGKCQLVYVGDSQQEIYAWTGAVNALANVKTDHRTFLTQSFRFGQAIADKANEILTVLDAPLRLTGNPAIESRLEAIENPRAILVRTNATGVTMLLKAQEEGIKANLVGGKEQVLGFAVAAQELQLTGRSFHPDLICFDSWGAVQSYVQDKEESGGEDLKLLVRLVDTFGVEAIIKGLETMPDDRFAELTISTAHRSKGREWAEVKLANDFPQMADSDKAALRLYYVACTRAKSVLDVTAITGGSDELVGSEAPLAEGSEPVGPRSSGVRGQVPPVGTRPN